MKWHGPRVNGSVRTPSKALLELTFESENVIVRSYSLFQTRIRALTGHQSRFSSRI